MEPSPHHAYLPPKCWGHIMAYTDQYDPSGQTVDRLAGAFKNVRETSPEWFEAKKSMGDAWSYAKECVNAKIRRVISENEAVVERIKEHFPSKYFGWMDTPTPVESNKYAPRDDIRNKRVYWEQLGADDRLFCYAGNGYAYQKVKDSLTQRRNTLLFSEVNKVYLLLCKITWFPLAIKNAVFNTNSIKADAGLDTQALVVMYDGIRVETLTIQATVFVFAKMAAASGHLLFEGLTHLQKYEVAKIAACNGLYRSHAEFSNKEEFALRWINVQNDVSFTHTGISNLPPFRKSFPWPNPKIPTLGATQRDKTEWVYFFASREHKYKRDELITSNLRNKAIYEIAKRLASQKEDANPNQIHHNPWYVHEFLIGGNKVLELAKAAAKANIAAFARSVELYKASTPALNALAEYVFIQEKMDLKYLPGFEIDLKQTLKILDARRNDVTPIVWIRLCTKPFRIATAPEGVFKTVYSALHNVEELPKKPKIVRQWARDFPVKAVIYCSAVSHPTTFETIFDRLHEKWPDAHHKSIFLLTDKLVKRPMNAPNQFNRQWNSLIALISQKLTREQVKQHLANFDSQEERFEIARIIAKEGLHKSKKNATIDISQHIDLFSLSLDQNRKIADIALFDSPASLAWYLDKYNFSSGNNFHYENVLKIRHANAPLELSPFLLTPFDWESALQIEPRQPTHFDYTTIQVPQGSITTILDFLTSLPPQFNCIDLMKAENEKRKNSDDQQWNVLVNLLTRRLSSDKVKALLAEIPSEYDRFKIAIILARREMQIKTPRDLPIDISEHIQSFDLTYDHKYQVACVAAIHGGLAFAGLLHSYHLNQADNGDFAMYLIKKYHFDALNLIRTLPVDANAAIEVNNLFTQNQQLPPPLVTPPHEQQQ